MGSGRNIDETTLPTYDDETSGTKKRSAGKQSDARPLLTWAPFAVVRSLFGSGVIPRAARQIFRRIAALTEEAEAQGLVAPTFRLSCTFVELYNEKFFDLLATGRKEVKLADQSDGTNADFSNATVDDVRTGAHLADCSSSAALCERASRTPRDWTDIARHRSRVRSASLPSLTRARSIGRSERQR